MQKLDFTLTEKKQLTHDVYELTFVSSELSESLPGQYTMFILPKSGLRRAYSIAFTDGNTFSFIIKQLGWGVGSTEICSLGIGETIPGMSPLGHFVLRETNAPKLFIGTGTGFAPLYFQSRAMIENGIEAKSLFVFGVRSNGDRFYGTELDRMKEQTSWFDYRIYLSQDDAEWCIRWRVTDFLTQENIGQFQEFYICGSPAMVKDSRTKLEELGISKEQIFFEQY